MITEYTAFVGWMIVMIANNLFALYSLWKASSILRLQNKSYK